MIAVVRLTIHQAIVQLDVQNKVRLTSKICLSSTNRYKIMKFIVVILATLRFLILSLFRETHIYFGNQSYFKNILFVHVTGTPPTLSTYSTIFLDKNSLMPD